jgi:ferredoxin--NADP+ reductase
MSEPRLPKVQMNLVRPKDPVVGRVVSNDLCMNGKSASFVKHLVLDVSNTKLAGTFRAGQSFGVIAPGTDEQGKPHKVRLYSIACASWGEDGKATLLSTTPKRLIEETVPQKTTDDPSDHRLFLGVCSNYLCDVTSGDDVLLTGPNGKRFLLPEDTSAHNYLFLATGTGIAPFRGMLLELLEGPSPCTRRIDLVMGTPYTTDLLYDDLFRRLAAKYENFHYHTAISREAGPTGRGVYVDGLIDRDIDTFAPLIESRDTLIYVCGLEGMQFGLYRTLARHGLAGGYMNVKQPLADVSPEDWLAADMKRNIKPTARCMLETY